MSRYFTRLAQRSGMHGTATSAKRSITAPDFGGAVEVKQKTVAPTVSTSQTKKQHTQTTSATIATNNASERGDNGNTSRSQNYPNRHQAVTTELPHAYPQVDSMKSSQRLRSNTRIEERSVKYFDQKLKRLNLEGTENTRQSDAEVFSEHIHKVISEEQGIKGTLTERNSVTHTGRTQPGSEVAAVKPSTGHSDVMSTQHMTTESTPFPAPKVALSTTPEEPVSITTVSTRIPSNDGLPEITDTKPSMLYVPTVSIPRKLSDGTKYQDIEINIGSLSMEVHEKQPVVTPPPTQPGPKTNCSRPESAEHLSSFRPGRYYLRGA